MSFRSMLVIAALFFPAAPVSGQDRAPGSPWGGSFGLGAGIHLQCGECEAKTAGLGATAGVQREIRPGFALGVTWTGGWFDSDFGTLNRHAFNVDLLFSSRTAKGSHFVRLGIGPAVSTSVTVEGPPDPPGVGDMVVSIGDTMGFGGGVGIGIKKPVTESVSLDPEFRVLAQRVDGETLAFAVAMISFSIG